MDIQVGALRRVQMMELEGVVRAELEQLLQSPDADRWYDELPDTDGGRILNSDSAREISPRYRSYVDRVAFTHATYAPAAAYVMDRFLDTVKANPGPGRKALLLAGGPASGKTVSVQADDLSDYDLVFDTTLASYEKALTIVNCLLNAKWDAGIQFIFRPYRLAVESMLERAGKTGRYVCLGNPSRLAQVHVAAQRTFCRLAKEFANRLEFGVVGNFGSRDNPVPPAPLEIATIDTGGLYHYDRLEDLYAAQTEIFEKFSQANQDKETLLAAIREVQR